MNEPRLLPDDPRLTAYALGELTGDERAAVEAALRQNPALRSVVDDIRATAVHLEAALAAEVADTADVPVSGSELNGHARPFEIAKDYERAAIVPGRDFAKFDGGDYRVPTRGKLLKFPQFYYVVGGFAAACLAVIVAFNRDEYDAKRRANEARLAPERIAAEASREATVVRPLLLMSPAEETAAVTPPGPPRASTHGGSDSVPGAARAAPAIVDRREPRRPAPRGANFGPNTGTYAHLRDNDFVSTAQTPLSTFAVDVDTASYANVRRFIEQGAKPPPDVVRIEEMLNYFPYRYAAPKGDTPFEASMEVADAPWAPGHRLVRIGLRGRDPGIQVEQVSSPLVPIARDVKVQVEFNPAKVQSYRLIGYENRLQNKEGFNHDKVDAGEIGAGHTVTALYEIVPVGARPRPNAIVAAVDEPDYSANDAFSSRPAMPGAGAPGGAELLTVKVRFKKPNRIFSWAHTLEFSVAESGNAFDKASADFRFAAAVAQFGMILRGSPHQGTGTLGDVIAWAGNAAARSGDDPGGYRGEFIDLVRKAQVLLQ